ncbi:MAG TPA: hypothetical protein VEO74_07165 [Thermoanaerobaculia bacterium]|nr:hypothetical protein [Thermoanaerobaculia bacterium]
MLGFALLCAAIVATGYGIVRRLYDAPRLELLVSGALAGTILWIAANWALAITFTLTRRNLLIVAGAFVAAGIWSAATALPLSVRWRAWSVGAMVAIALWCAFVLWRASVVPPASHDVLTYHLPKAVMMARAHGYERFDVPDFRIATFPSNYELLLTDVLLLGDGDRLTEWIGTVSYLLLLGVVAVAARRWWGQGVHVVASVMAAAGAPLLLLHSGHDKNDVMTAAFAAAALLWSARWCAERGAMPAMLAIACGATAVGTKITAGPVVLGIAPFGIAALLRKPPRPKALTAALLFAVCAFLLCGGWVFLQNAQAKTLPANVSSGVPMAEYGQWSHLWKVPIMMLRVSLGLSTEWPWPSENLFSSHYGSVFGLAALSLPLCIWTYRREGDEPLRRERTVAGIAAAIAFFILLPLIQYPQLALPSILRYTAFVLPVIYGWTVAPLVRSLAMSRFRRYVHAVMAVLVAIFAANAADMAMNDAFAPLPYARWCAEHPGTRAIFWSSGHAETVVDRLAGPHDKIAIHGAGDTWIYPAYGAALSRAVVFVNSVEEIPADAEWVAIDSNPADTQLYEALARDRRFRLVYRQQRDAQAVFRRVGVQIEQKEKGPRV